MMDDYNEEREERMQARREAAHAERMQDKRDAERYRYLRESHVRKWVSDLPHNKNAPSLDLDFSAEGHDLDAALDRAMQGANTAVSDRRASSTD